MLIFSASKELKMIHQHGGRSYFLERYPTTNDRSLRPLSAADELLLDWPDYYAESNQVAQEKLDSKGVVILHDRFGALATILHDHQPQFVSSFASQTLALQKQLARNKLDQQLMRTCTPLEDLEPTDVGLLRIPKSLELFELYLAQFAQMAGSKVSPSTLFAGFMTRHFTPALLKIAERYAHDIGQTKARKKARLLQITNFRADAPKPEELIKSIAFNGVDYQQYYGTFSANHIDYATQFLLEYLGTNPVISFEGAKPLAVLDLGCGNGVIGLELLRKSGGKLQLTAIDDFYLATLSTQMNLKGTEATVLWSDGLAELGAARFDLVVTNPPFHFGYETNIEVSRKLFAQVAGVLKPGGKFVVVSNRHLNYSTHLRQLYGVVEQLCSNDKFEVLLAEQPIK